ncbi:MAG TPA: secondary thiamine-phosphate synthase enzyme YjbQ [Phycisphaerales bacterium]|nr:secondary thiamine-phosphate synthase enzyme YjbQ [Phycisphaerales bacterium]
MPRRGAMVDFGGGKVAMPDVAGCEPLPPSADEELDEAEGGLSIEEMSVRNSRGHFLFAGSKASVDRFSTAVSSAACTTSDYASDVVRSVIIRTSRQGLHEITGKVAEIVQEANQREGLCTIFIRHTSASLVIQENADPSARHDLETWLNRLVPEGDERFTHHAEGPDDMPAHIKAALTATSLSIPIDDGRLGLGRWQGIYLWEHRRAAHERTVLVHVTG